MSKRKLIKGITLFIAVAFVFLNIVPGTLAWLVDIADPIVNIFEVKDTLPPDTDTDTDTPGPGPGPGPGPDTETETDTDTDTEKDTTESDTEKPEDKTGSLVINKLVEHPYSADYVYPENLKFEFEVALGVAYAHKSFNSTRGTIVADEWGKLYFSVSPDKSYSIDGIPEGTQVTVTEKNSEGKGFAVVGDASRTAVIGAADTIVTFVNSYKPERFDFSGASGIDLLGVKILEGREWAVGDTFKFVLERRVGEAWVKIGTSTISYNPEKSDFNEFNFSEALNTLNIENIGTYYFRVYEEIGDIDYISYDKTVNYFELKMSDDDMNGKLELLNSNISVHNNISSVSQNSGKRALKVTFNNTYEPPARPADLNVFVTANNVILGDSDGVLSADMFSFVVENVNTGDKTVQVSEKNGKTVFAITFTADDIGLTKHYRMYQLVEDLENVTYSNVAYDIYITVALDGDNRLTATIVSNGVEYSDFVGEFETIYRKPSVIDPPITPGEDRFYPWPLIVDGVIISVIAVGWPLTSFIYKRRTRKK